MEQWKCYVEYRSFTIANGYWLLIIGYWACEKTKNSYNTMYFFKTLLSLNFIIAKNSTEQIMATLLQLLCSVVSCLEFLGFLSFDCSCAQPSRAKCRWCPIGLQSVILSSRNTNTDLLTTNTFGSTRSRSTSTPEI